MTPDYIQSFTTSSNILIIQALNLASQLNNNERFSLSHSLISSISIIATKFDIFKLSYTDGVSVLTNFDSKLSEYKNEHTLSYRFITAYSHDIHTYIRTYQAQRDLERARIMTALAIHFKMHDAYPGALSALEPEILKHVPTNPMTGEPFKYTLLPDGQYELKDELAPDDMVTRTP